MSNLQQEIAFDRFSKPQRSDFDIDSPNYDSTGLDFDDNFPLSALYSDLILAQFLDVSDNNITTDADGLQQVNTKTESFRKCRVLMVGKLVAETAVGDIVVCPNDRGLKMSSVAYLDNGVLKHAKHTTFLTERKLLSKAADMRGKQ